LHSHAAAQGGNVDALRAILNERRAADSKEGTNFRPTVPLISYLFITIAFQSFIDAYDNDRWTALQYASWEGHMAIISELVPLTGATSTLSLGNPNGATALHLAAGTGRLEVVQYLLARGADRTLVNNERQKSIDLVRQLR
jgi:hypothetical protein